jgi:D-serine deaminase-like pyridoxal phosphate-dependent protein
MPIGADRVHDVASLQSQIGSKGTIRVMVDHPAQVKALDEYNARSGRSQAWGVFVKVDGGGR